MWMCYRIYLEAKSPIHIGYGAKLGVVNRTRYYIPAKNIWGALTNLVAKSIMKTYNLKIYQEVGRKLNENIKFSYFFPIKYERNNRKIKVFQVFIPHYTEEGLKFGIYEKEEKISLEEFEQMYISSFISTALDKRLKSAEEGSLHEIEFIRDKIEQDGKTKSTIFMGYLFVKNVPLKFEVEGNEIEISFTNSIEVNGVRLNEIWVGGERNYGFGRMKIFLIEKESRNNLFGTKLKVDVENEQVVINSKKNPVVVISHIDIENIVKLVKGDIEPLIGREWNEKGPGQKITEMVKICVTPGSEVIYDGKIIIGDFGIWKVVK